MKCIAIDDEPMALNIIAQFCKRMGDMELSTYTNPLAGWEQVKRTRPDIVFLDIEMGGVNGVELARELPAGVFLIFIRLKRYSPSGMHVMALPGGQHIP